MKKLLSLLSVLTISGTAVPTTIAASPYQKEKNLNSDINYQQTNNLKNLSKIKRVKRDYNNIKIEENGILRTTRKTISSNLINGTTNYERSNFNYSPGLKAFTRYRHNSIYAPLNPIYNIPPKEDIFYKGNLPIKDTFASLDNNNFYFITTSGAVYQYNHIIGANIIFSPSTLEKAIICVVHLKNNVYFATTDGSIYEYNDSKEELKKIFNTNSSVYSIYAIHSDLTDNKIYFGVNNGNFYEYWPYEELQDDNVMNLLKEWNDDFNTWQGEVKRQIKEDVPTFTDAQKRTWKDDKNFQLRTQMSLLKDKLWIIKNHDEINKLNNIVSDLKSEINKIYNQIDNLYKSLKDIQNNLNKPDSEICQWNKNFGKLSVFNFIPVYSEIFSAAKNITSIGCEVLNL